MLGRLGAVAVAAGIALQLGYLGWVAGFRERGADADPATAGGTSATQGPARLDPEPRPKGTPPVRPPSAPARAEEPASGPEGSFTIFLGRSPRPAGAPRG